MWWGRGDSLCIRPTYINWLNMCVFKLIPIGVAARVKVCILRNVQSPTCGSQNARHWPLQWFLQYLLQRLAHGIQKQASANSCCSVLASIRLLTSLFCSVPTHLKTSKLCYWLFPIFVSCSQSKCVLCSLLKCVHCSLNSQNCSLKGAHLQLDTSPLGHKDSLMVISNDILVLGAANLASKTGYSGNYLFWFFSPVSLLPALPPSSWQWLLFLVLFSTIYCYAIMFCPKHIIFLMPLFFSSLHFTLLYFTAIASFLPFNYYCFCFRTQISFLSYPALVPANPATVLLLHHETFGSSAA